VVFVLEKNGFFKHIFAFLSATKLRRIIMSRTFGLDDIPLDVFRGVVAFGMGRFTVGRLEGA